MTKSADEVLEINGSINTRAEWERALKKAKREASKTPWLWALVLVVGFYVAAQMISNVMSLRIVYLGGLSLDAGSLLYPLTFVLRDVVHRVGGKQVARAAIVVGALANLLMVSMFQFTSVLPADMAVGSQEEFGALLAPAVRLAAASIIVQIIAELIDTEVYHAWVKKFKERMIWGRVLVSNAVSVPIDAVLFTYIAFYGDMPTAVLWSIIVSNIILKFALTVLFLPLIYTVKVPARMKHEMNLED